MLVVGIDDPDRDDDHVHSIDLWFSPRRGLWVVERLNMHGHVIGHAHYCATEADATACLHEWLRSHQETHLIAPRPARAGSKIMASPKRRAA